MILKPFTTQISLRYPCLKLLNFDSVKLGEFQSIQVSQRQFNDKITVVVDSSGAKVYGEGEWNVTYMARVNGVTGANLI